MVPLPNNSPSSNPAEDIRPIHDAVSIPVPPAETSYMPVILWSLAGILALVAIIALIVWLKRRAAANRIPNLRQKALRQLKKAEPLMLPEQSREYTIAVSDILRQFIEGRFQLPSTRRTTPEFLQALSKNPHIDLGPYRDTLNHFFNQCDLGKFSGSTLTQRELSQLHEAALDVIRSEASNADTSPKTETKTKPNQKISA